tara:strand:+ start:1884 stop:2840 length:957 start_codon:yes stop_codon:yes gene_type:complete
MSLFNYIEHGARLSAGFWPVTADELSRMQVNAAAPGKGMRFESYGPHVFKSDVSGSASNRFKVPTHVGTQAGYANMSLLGKAATWSTPIVGLGASTYFVASGFSEGGMQGAMSAAWVDVATMSATSSALFRTTPGGVVESAARHGIIGSGINRLGIQRSATKYGAAPGGHINGRTKSRLIGFAGGMKNMRVMLGAGIGATFGMEMGGMPGSFLGAYTMGQMARTPYLTGATILAGAATNMTAKAGINFLKAGYRKERNRRRIDTAGGMASFMTQNAFTSRQRAVSAMQNSHLNARSAMGMEATYMHMNRDYFSQYRRM